MEMSSNQILPLSQILHRPPRDSAFDVVHTKSHTQLTLTEASSSLLHTETDPETLDIIRRAIGGGGAMVEVAEKAKPLNLLDLPLDILSLIVQDITHTNDLCALALSHSALHSLAIPYIYSRFDIVWPDATTSTESRSGVDALTYGLATLVMAEDVFGDSSTQARNNRERNASAACSLCNHCNSANTQAVGPTSGCVPLAKRKRRGNNYATFVRKFSLGNGPNEWVQDYRTTTDCGKMLGSLVALAVARMTSLETFIWDMPTGVVRDVWQALASLGDRSDCRLQKLWIRWHSNAQVEGNQAPPQSPPSNSNGFPQPISTSIWESPGNDAQANRHRNKVERSTFSILSPLTSLTVLDIDELAYLDEMSVLVATSRNTLRELRVGIAKEASGCNWTGALEGGGLQQLPENTSKLLTGTCHYDKRLGGVLGVLVAHTYSMRVAEPAIDNVPPRHSGSTAGGATMAQLASDSLDATMAQIMLDNDVPKPSMQLSNFVLANSTGDQARKRTSPLSHPLQPASGSDEVRNSTLKSRDFRDNSPVKENSKLDIATLELERVPLSISVLVNAFNWSKLTNLTLLNCPNHDRLWRALRNKFSPKQADMMDTMSERQSDKTAPVMNYELNLRKLRTNTVSSALIIFLKDTLAPNSLESLFLQRSRYCKSVVTIDQIHRGPIRRHRESLRHLSVDSHCGGLEEGSPAVGFKKWTFDRELMAYITSGRMPALRELAISVQLKDWHYFLQRLRFIPQLHSLFVLHVSKDDENYVPDHEVKELALQIIDVLTLRPEIEICYLAIGGKCFEVLESRPGSKQSRRDGDASSSISSESADSGDDDDEMDSEDDDEGVNDGHSGSASDLEDQGDRTETEDESSTDDDDDSDAGAFRENQVRLRLREILFYDDKIAIFKARHGRL